MITEYTVRLLKDSDYPNSRYVNALWEYTPELFLEVGKIFLALQVLHSQTTLFFEQVLLCACVKDSDNFNSKNDFNAELFVEDGSIICMLCCAKLSILHFGDV